MLKKSLEIYIYIMFYGVTVPLKEILLEPENLKRFLEANVSLEHPVVETLLNSSLHVNEVIIIINDRLIW